MINGLKLVMLSMVILSLPSLALAAKPHRAKKHQTAHSSAKKNHATAARTAAPSAAAAAPAVYKVKKSESLARIAKKTGVSVAELKRLNGLSGRQVKAGKVLVLRESQPAEEAAPKIARRESPQLRHPDLYNEKDYEQSLQELAELTPDQERPVDLRKSTELKVDNISELKKSAYGFLGTRYRFGGNSRSTGIDCSSFVQKVFRELEVSLPRTAREQFEVGSSVAPGDLQKGDLIFFHTYASYPSHVGIYLGNNKMIHASSRDHRVVISPMNTAYYRSHFIGAKRISKVNPDVFRFDDLIMGIEEESADQAQQNDTLDLASGD